MRPYDHAIKIRLYHTLMLRLSAMARGADDLDRMTTKTEQRHTDVLIAEFRQCAGDNIRALREYAGTMPVLTLLKFGVSKPTKKERVAARYWLKKLGLGLRPICTFQQPKATQKK